MISALIVAGRNVEALGATLASLVPAVADGLVREAVIVDADRSEDVRQVADAAGAIYVELVQSSDPWLTAAEAAKGPWLLLLEAGDLAEQGWSAEAQQFLARAGRQTGAGLFRHEAATPALDRLAAVVFRRSRPRPGLLCAKASLSRGTRSLRCRPLSTRIRRS